MRALITGASGFVGRQLHHHLREMGDEVVPMSRTTGGPELTDRDGYREKIGAANVDVVYHLAGQAHVPTSWSDPIATIRANVEGTQNVIDAAHHLGGCRTIVVTSAEVYGSVAANELPIDEEFPLRPANPYAASKVAADALALQAFLGRGQDVIRMRSFNHIGPGQRTDFVCAGLAHRIALAERTGQTQIDVGSLDARRDFCDVRDVVAAYRLAAVADVSGTAYNVCSGVDRSIREVTEQFRELSSASLTFVSRSDLQRGGEISMVRRNNALLRRDTGWEPAISFSTSIADILEHARTHQQNEAPPNECA